MPSFLPSVRPPFLREACYAAIDATSSIMPKVMFPLTELYNCTTVPTSSFPYYHCPPKISPPFQTFPLFLYPSTCDLFIIFPFFMPSPTLPHAIGCYPPSHPQHTHTSTPTTLSSSFLRLPSSCMVYSLSPLSSSPPVSRIPYVP